MQDPLGPTGEASLSVSDGQLHFVDAGEEGTATRSSLEGHPAILELPGAVGGQGCERSLLIGLDQEASVEENVEAASDPENQFVAISKAPQTFAEDLGQQVSRGLTRPGLLLRHRGAMKDQNLKTLQERRLIAKALDGERLDLGACRLEGDANSLVSRGASLQKEYPWLGHDTPMILWGCVLGLFSTTIFRQEGLFS
jgi:hypothetical protein